jgi:23S rRNA pseudouridine1911/1915/1917 synthase
MPPSHVLTVPADGRGQRLDKFLATELAARGLSRSRIRRILDQGGVLVDKALRPAKYSLRGGETLSVELPKAVSKTLKAADIPLQVLYEDKHLLVINKPAGLVTHPGAGHSDDTLANALLHHCGPSLQMILGSRRPGIVHRLDKDTSGCMVAAKSEEAFTGLQAMIAAREVKRIYLALAWGDLPEDSGTIDAPLGRGADRRRMDVRPGSGKAAVTHFTVLQRFSTACELECRLETGRTHQIRAHLKSINHAVVGDRSYSRPPQHLSEALALALAEVLKRQALHAYKLEFRHPVTGKWIKARAPEPADYRAARKLLKAAA